MSVILKGRRWPRSRVPYFINGGTLEHDAWFDEVNRALQFPLLVQRTFGDSSVLQLNVGGPSKSEQIGWSGNATQVIGGTDKQTVVHELLHALGFRHEQLHKGFPWDDNDPKLTSVDRMYAYKTKIKGASNRLLFEKIMGRMPEFFADNNLSSRLEAILDTNNEHWAQCDLDSVMMYSNFRSAVIAANLTHSLAVTQSGKSAACNVLSNLDVDALRYMYPRP
jgi:hypothetical protein